MSSARCSPFTVLEIVEGSYVLFKEGMLNFEPMNKKDHETVKVLCISCNACLHLQHKQYHLEMGSKIVN